MTAQFLILMPKEGLRRLPGKNPGMWDSIEPVSNQDLLYQGRSDQRAAQHKLIL
jgi:hypothetical protein